MKNDETYIFHIIDAIEQINEYTKGISISVFKKDRMMQDAVIRNFEIIGEAAKQVSEQMRKKHSMIPWKKMAGMRDKLIHGYMGVDLDAVWNTIVEILPTLKGDLEKIMGR